MREALRSLQVLGYIEHRPHVGAMVRTYRRHEIEEAYQIRQALETHCLLHASYDLAALGRRARPGAGLATWTVAAVVRRGLDEAGFEVARRPGLPPKRHCLAGRRRPGA